jgi:hypothetical protein
MLLLLFGAVLSASASLAREIRTGTALAVLSNQSARRNFAGQYVGLMAALTVLSYESDRGVAGQPDGFHATARPICCPRSLAAA